MTTNDTWHVTRERLLAKRYPAISLRSAWAWAVCHAGKRIENRSWTTPYRGLLWVHASAQPPSPSERAALKKHGLPEAPQRSALVALCRLTDIVRHNSKKGPTKGDPWAMGPFCWILDEVRVTPEPVLMPGRLSLWYPQAQMILRD